MDIICPIICLDENCEPPFYQPSTQEIKILKLRTGSLSISAICKNHKRIFLSQYANHQRSCCDPFSRHVGKRSTAALREITLPFSEKHNYVTLIPGKKLCSSCRGEIPRHAEMSDSSSCASQESFHDEAYECVSEEIAVLNTSLCNIGESPIEPEKFISRKRYPEDKFKKISSNIRKRLKLGESSKLESEDGDKYKKGYEEMITQLKEKFVASKERSTKMQVMTVLPKSWTSSKLEEEFGVSNYTARAVKSLVATKGILSTPNPKPGKSLPQSVVDMVHDFYTSDDISRAMPGIKDCKTVITPTGKERVQKRLILCNLKEAHCRFKDTFPGEEIGFSKFAQLRPSFVVLPGASGTHSVCVCTIHQNVKLMLEGSGIVEGPTFKSLISHDYTGKVTYKHLLSHLACNPPQIKCHLLDCDSCGTGEDLIEQIKKIFDESSVDHITYKAWISCDRTTLETITKDTEEFCDNLLEKLQNLMRHDFIAKQQTAFLKSVKESEIGGMVAVIGDFAENYSFVLQDAAQGFHWTNHQATIHPFVAYHSAPLQHTNFVVISDCLKHDTAAVHCFQKHLLNHLKSTLPLVNKIMYFSDGAASQYKNRKNFINLAFHTDDFGVPAEWHFFATSHGKNACDGLGGTVKRLAARTSLQRPYEGQIQTPRQLYEFAKASMKGISFVFVPTDEIERERDTLAHRFEKAITIPGTQKLHCFIPILENKQLMVAKFFSASDNKQTVTISCIAPKVTLNDISGYIICKYDGRWWLAYILNKLFDTEEVTVTFLHPNGPAMSFHYPNMEDKLVLPIDSLLLAVNPITETGRIYKLSHDESIMATQKLLECAQE